MKNKTITGFKAFNKGMKCRGFQFEEGQVYEEAIEPKVCSQGFHFCRNPFDVFRHYPLIGSEFATVEALGKVDEDTDEDSKVATDKIFIKAKLDLSAFINASVAFIFEQSKVKKSNSATSGDDAHSATSGNRANSATSGYGAHSATSGVDNAIACSVGRKAKAKASLGCFIVLAEWYEGEKFTDARPLGVYSKKVDGKKIKADQWYKIVDGKFIETDDSND